MAAEQFAGESVNSLHNAAAGWRFRPDSIFLLFVQSRRPPCMCRSHMRSSCWSQVESSALIRHGGTTTGAVDVAEGSGAVKGATCSEAEAHHARAGGEGVGNHGPLGTGVAGADESARRWGGGARVAGEALEPAFAGGHE